MTLYEKTETTALLGYDSDKCKLELIHLGHPVDHATAFGRIAFSCPSKQLPEIESLVKNEGHTILTPLVSLDTPGKATVEVVILADPVGCRGRRALSIHSLWRIPNARNVSFRKFVREANLHYQLRRTHNLVSPENRDELAKCTISHA